MKKSILTTLLLASVSIMTAQITINRSHVITSGQVVVQATDSNQFAVQKAGTNKTWNFSTLKATSKDTQKFNPPQWYPGYTHFPNANMAIKTVSDDSSFTFLKINNNEITFEGSYELFDDTFQVIPFKRKFITFPSTYNTSFTDNSTVPFNTFELGIDIDSTGPLPMIDSIRINFDIRVKSSIQGWGSIVTPLGTYNALLQNTEVINGAKLDMLMNGNWIALPANIAALLGFGSFPADTSYDHQFWTNDATIGFPIVSYSFSKGETTTSDVNWLQTKPQTTGIKGVNTNGILATYPNPCHNSFNVTLPVNIKAELSIFDLNSKLVRTVSVENGSLVDMTGLENGVYTLQFTDTSSGQYIGVQKIIRN